MVIMVGQILVFGVEIITEKGGFAPFAPGSLKLLPALVLQGEVWRVVTFIFERPPALHPVFLIFAWGIFYYTGSTLEQAWGDLKYNLFVGTGMLATAGVSFVILALVPPQLQGLVVVGSGLMLNSVFLAFAWLNPNVEFHIFFVLPVKVKWLAAIDLAILALEFGVGTAYNRLVILASLVNLILFLGRDIAARWRGRSRRVAHRKRVQVQSENVFHTCKICGATDKTHPDRDFLYAADDGYCEECQQHMPDEPV